MVKKRKLGGVLKEGDNIKGYLYEENKKEDNRLDLLPLKLKDLIRRDLSYEEASCSMNYNKFYLQNTELRDVCESIIIKNVENASYKKIHKSVFELQESQINRVQSVSLLDKFIKTGVKEFLVGVNGQKNFEEKGPFCKSLAFEEDDSGVNLS